MKFCSTVATLLTVIFATSATANPLPNAQKFKGQGEWRDSEGNKGSYAIETTFDGLSMLNKYQFDGQNVELTYKISKISDGFYSLMVDDRPFGELYCMDVQCHYSGSKHNVEETLTFYEHKLYKLGSKKGPNGSTVTWQESLVEVP